jgi:pyrroline-5-carboxylate reductase
MAATRTDIRLDDADAVDATSGLTLGFIGCGTIASAIITGFSKQSVVRINSIVVSRRSESKSSVIQQQYPHLVVVEDNNQNIVDVADIVFLTVLPQQASPIIQALHFQGSKHVLVSLVSTSKIESLSHDSKLPIEQVFKMICLPAVAYAEGICLLQPKPRNVMNADANSTINLLEQLFDTLGGVVIAENDKEMAAMMVPSSLMGSFYGILQNNRDWLVNRHNISNDKATVLVSRMYYSMIQDAMRKFSNTSDEGSHLFDDLIAEQTPGGLNEQVLANLKSLGVMEAYDIAQDSVVRRILGETDGSLH